MNPARPEAETEYSRAHPRPARDSGPGAGGRGRPRPAILTGGTLGAGLLLVAEFTPLLSVHSSGHRGLVATVGTGPHHSFALVPVALLALALAYAAGRAGSRPALLAIGVLGGLALLISLLGDLPDAQASGLIGTAATQFVGASASPSRGLYLETLGAIVLLITGVGGLLLPGTSDPPGRIRRGASADRTRSAS